MAYKNHVNLDVLSARLNREEREHLEQLEYIFSLESSLYETRIHNMGEEINMKDYHNRLCSNMAGLSKKIYELSYGVF